VSTRKTMLQQRILAELARTQEKSNAQIAAAAGCSEAYACRVLARAQREGLATSRYAEDAEDPQTHYRLWRRAS